MYFVLVGVLLLALKWAEIDPVAAWSWWIILAPFACAAVWWAWSDASGHSRRRAMDKMQQRKEERRRRNMEAIGTAPKRRR